MTNKRSFHIRSSGSVFLFHQSCSKKKKKIKEQSNIMNHMYLCNIRQCHKSHLINMFTCFTTLTSLQLTNKCMYFTHLFSDIRDSSRLNAHIYRYLFPHSFQNKALSTVKTHGEKDFARRTFIKPAIWHHLSNSNELFSCSFRYCLH